jgi:hypothetical protein
VKNISIASLGRAVAVLIAMQVSATNAWAEEVVALSGGNGLLNAPKSVAASVVLIPGLDGYLGIAASGGVTVQEASPIVSTRADYTAHGVASLLIDKNVSTSSAIEYLRRFGKPIVVVGFSNGSLRLVAGLGSHPAGFVSWSGKVEDVKAAIGNPSSLPPTLIIHNHNDKCPETPPGPVDSFKAWGGSRVKVLWVGGGEPPATNTCSGRGAAPHFMPGHEAEVVSAIASFAKSVR